MSNLGVFNKRKPDAHLEFMSCGGVNTEGKRPAKGTDAGPV